MSIRSVEVQVQVPSGLFLSVGEPGMRSIKSKCFHCFTLNEFVQNLQNTHTCHVTRVTHSIVRYHLRAILMGVVRQLVKMSAGKSGFMGRISWALQAASRIKSFTRVVLEVEVLLAVKALLLLIIFL
jgi:hypothetical protein